MARSLIFHPPKRLPPNKRIAMIEAFARHRIAPNLLMLIMILSGLIVTSRLETRFFPEFDTQVVQVVATWSGAAAEDVEEALLTPLENALRNVPDLKKMTSYSTDNAGRVYLEFPDDIDLDTAADDVRRYVDTAVAKLPSDSDAPEVQSIVQPDVVTNLALTGGLLTELRPLARRLENEFRRFDGIEVNTSGLPDEKIEIRFDQRRLTELNLSLADIGAQIAALNIDATAGNLDSVGFNRTLRTLSKRKSVAELAAVPILDGAGEYVRLGDIANIVRTSEDNGKVFFNGKPAVLFSLRNQSGGNILHKAEVIGDWLEMKRAELPGGVEITPHREEWRLVQSRLSLLVENGLQGLVLVLALLFLFLNWRVAFWVAAGIPATFMVALCVLYFAGGTINMISMFAFIMVTGIVVDDSIVVSENAMYHFEQGKSPLRAAVDGAKEMFAAVFSSTFTTISSFMPLMIVGGPIGAILFVIPLVVIAVLFAALFECFAVLPGHMAGAFSSIQKKRQRQRTAEKKVGLFERFQEGPFRWLITLCLRYRFVTIATAFVALVLSVSLMIGGVIKYRFFPGADLSRAVVNVQFVAGTSSETVEAYMVRLVDAMHAADAAFPNEAMVENYTMRLGSLINDNNPNSASGDEVASLFVYLTESDERTTPLPDFVSAFRARAPFSADLQDITISEQRGGPPGEDLQVQLSGIGGNILKAASVELQAAMLDIPGVSRPRDDMPYGKKQEVFELTSLGRSLNLSVGDIAAQLRNAFDGYKVQTFYEGVDEVEVRVLMEGGNLSEVFAAFQVRLPGGGTALLSDVVELRSRRGFDTVQRVNNEPVVNIIGDIDFSVTDVGAVLRQLEADVLPSLTQKYGVAYSFEGANADEQETVRDMKTGLILAAVLIFVILAAVFASWTMPLIIILTAPLGIIGAIIGHGVMGYDVSILSMFGVFALNGIVVNDSIVLVRDYLARRENNPAVAADVLIVDSTCRRLRAILLTSLTTVCGLIPLMFETSTQAQFLIPMAISICFGLAFATLLILFIMPAFLSVHESLDRTVTAIKRKVAELLTPTSAA